jgi:hypothetical protein
MAGVAGAYLVEKENSGVSGHLDADGDTLALIGRETVLRVVSDDGVGLALESEQLEEALGKLLLLLLGNAVRQTTLQCGSHTHSRG